MTEEIKVLEATNQNFIIRQQELQKRADITQHKLDTTFEKLFMLGILDVFFTQKNLTG